VAVTHQEIDARTLAMHRLVAEKIRRDPRLLDVARANLARWRLEPHPGDRGHLEEWERAMGAGLESALALAVEDSERAAALRQSSPFAGVLTARERHAFLRSWRAARVGHEAR
jgi:hypothetical protein